MSPTQAEPTQLEEHELPEYAKRLAEALASAFDADVEAERTGIRQNVRMIVRSEGFNGVPHMERQRLIGEVADRTITREQRFTIPLIMAFAPGDWDE